MKTSKYLVFDILKSTDYNSNYAKYSMNSILKKDIEEFKDSFPLVGELENTSFLITGASGLIGSILIHCLLSLNKNIRIIAPVRDLNRTKEIFSLEEQEYLTLIECNLLSFNYDRIGDVDYVIHCAAPTASSFFVEHPVETFSIIVDGTKVLLEYARQHSVKSFVYLSSLEVYGEVKEETYIDESFQGFLNPLSVRSSYPMAKRAAENLCCLYQGEYNTPAKIVRLTQTTGAGIKMDDNRVIALFTRLVAQHEDIVLYTTGESARPYCYTTDAIQALLYVLLRGNAGEAYNVANEKTYISAKSLAEYLRDNFSPFTCVKYDIKEGTGYAPPTKLKLSTKKVEALGWNPQYDLYGILSKLLSYIQMEL